jgi:hypothetical protein
MMVIGLNNLADPTASLFNLSGSIQPIMIHFPAYKHKNVIKEVKAAMNGALVVDTFTVLLTNSFCRS